MVTASLRELISFRPKAGKRVHHRDTEVTEKKTPILRSRVHHFALIGVYHRSSAVPFLRVLRASVVKVLSGCFVSPGGKKGESPDNVCAFVLFA